MTVTNSAGGSAGGGGRNTRPWPSKAPRSAGLRHRRSRSANAAGCPGYSLALHNLIDRQCRRDVNGLTGRCILCGGRASDYEKGASKQPRTAAHITCGSR